MVFEVKVNMQTCHLLHMAGGGGYSEIRQTAVKSVQRWCEKL